MRLLYWDCVCKCGVLFFSSFFFSLFFSLDGLLLILPCSFASVVMFFCPYLYIILCAYECTSVQLCTVYYNVHFSCFNAISWYGCCHCCLFFFRFYFWVWLTVRYEYWLPHSLARSYHSFQLYSFTLYSWLSYKWDLWQFHGMDFSFFCRMGSYRSASFLSSTLIHWEDLFDDFQTVKNYIQTYM